MHSCFLKLFEITIFLSHINPISKGKIGFTLIKNQLYKAKMYVMRVESRAPATSKMAIFVTVAKEWKLSRIVANSSISDVTVALDPVTVVW